MTILIGLILLILFWNFFTGDYQTSKTTSPKSVNTNNPSSSKFYSCNEVDIIVKHPESMEDGRVYDLSGNRIYKISKTMRDKSFKNKSYLGRKEFDSGTIRWVEINPDEIESELNKSEFIIQHSLEIKSKTTSKKPVSKKATSKSENDYDKEYVEFQNMMLGDNSPYHNEYHFLKTFHDKLKTGEIFLEDMKSYAISNYSDFDGAEIMSKTELFKQLEHISTVFLNEWEEKGNTDFKGFEAIEQYHSLSQFMINILGELLQVKLREL